MVYKYFNNECPLTRSYAISKDHFVPLSWGAVVKKYGIGGNTYANTILLDRNINSSKGTRNPFLWYEKYGKRHGISIEKWNQLVQHVAEKHNMSILDYTMRVNACYKEIVELKWFTQIKNFFEREGYIPTVFIYNALRASLNFSEIVERLGNARLVQYFDSKELQVILHETKTSIKSSND